MKGDKISSIVGLLLALYIMWQSVLIDIGGIHQPGPGFFLFVAAILLAVCSAIVLFQAMALKASAQEGQKAEKKGDWGLVGYVLGALIAYSIVFEWLGFVLATFMLVLFLLLALEPQKWWKMLVTAGLTSLGAYILFNYFLKSGLPEGILGLGF